MQEQLSHFSKQQVQSIRKAVLENVNQIAESTAKHIAFITTNKAIQDMEQKFSDLSHTQIQKIKKDSLEIANQVAENTAKHIASIATNKAIQDMEQKFSDLSHIQIQNIKKDSLETANQVAEKTANRIASIAINKAIQDMKQHLSSLSKEQIKNIKSATLSVASATAREVADNIVEDTVKRVTLAVTEKALQDMKQRYSNLLKAGLRTIISAAIEATTAHSFMNPEDRKKIADQAKNKAISAAKEIAFPDEDEQTTDYIKGASFSLPFEQCHWTNQNYTARIVKEHSFFPLADPLKSMLESWDTFKTSQTTENIDSNDIDKEFPYLSPLYDEFILSFFQESIKDTSFSENDVPLECFFASAARGANIYNPGKSFYYCEKNSTRSGNMSVTDHKKKKRKVSPRRACLNKDYTYLTAKAFNKTADCFGFDKAVKEKIFKLFNHESSFLHNIKSPTGAKCYGQLTPIAIREINKQIYFSDTSSPLPYSYIFNEVIEKCPGLQSAILNPKIYKPVEQTGRKSMKKFNQTISKLPINCKITQNPYSCLFYAFYNIKINSAEIENQLKGPTSFFNKTRGVDKEFKNKFFLPIPLDTMIGVTTIEGKSMIFWDDSEIWRVLKHYPSNRLSHIKQLPLFENEKEVKELFSYWSYNGGISITSIYMTRFLKALKQAIANPCPSHSKTKICQYRFAVQKGIGLSTEDIKRDFQIYIQNNYLLEKHANRRKEVISFASNVEKSLNYLYNKNGRFRIHLKNLVPELENHEIESFQDHLIKVCPKP